MTELLILKEVKAVVAGGKAVITVGPAREWQEEKNFQRDTKDPSRQGWFASQWQGIQQAMADGENFEIPLTDATCAIRMSGGVAWFVRVGGQDKLVLAQRSKTKPDGSFIPRPLVLDVPGGKHDREYERWWGMVAGEAGEFCLTNRFVNTLLLPDLQGVDKHFRYVLWAEMLRTFYLLSEGGDSPEKHNYLPTSMRYVDAEVLPIQTGISVAIDGITVPVAMTVESDGLSLEPRILARITPDDEYRAFDLEGQMRASDSFQWLNRTTLLVAVDTGETEVWRTGECQRRVPLTEILREIDEIPLEARSGLRATEKVGACIKAYQSLGIATPGLAPLLK
ncbi:MAG: hypothetical protein HY459_04875 [Parcubacteria group bacterium]|nr:hypothetical protein [Parcubacteria group bacterium]